MIDRPYVPERDLFRLIKFGTYDIQKLYNDLNTHFELTEEEKELVYQYEFKQMKEAMEEDMIGNHK